MKKYKHKITGNIAVETNSGNNYKVSEPKSFTIPKWIVENSSDWEEIEEPLFITEDGVEKFAGDSCYYIVSSNYRIGNGIVVEGAEFKMALARFNDPIRADKWVRDNFPKYSRNDVINAMEHCKQYSRNGNSEFLFNNWLNSPYNNKK